MHTCGSNSSCGGGCGDDGSGGPPVATPVTPVPPVVIGPFATGRATAAGAKFQSARRNADGSVTPIVGDDIDSGNGLFGVLAQDVPQNGQAVVARPGAFVPGSGLPAGDLVRNAAGMPVPRGSLVVPTFPAVAFTNPIGVGSVLGLDVQNQRQEPVL